MTGLVAVVVSLVAAGSPPHVGHVHPPPALLRAEAGAAWMGYGSYCWRMHDRGRCEDYTDDYGGAPTLPLREGETIRIDLGFRPRSVDVILDGHGRHPLPAARLLRWRVEGRPRELAVAAFTDDGSALYGVRAR